MKFLPICINITGKKILIVGGGRTALQKLKTLIKYTDDITVCAPEICDEIISMGIECRKREYHTKILNGVSLVFACTNNETANKRILIDARKNGLLVNISDNPTMSDFVSPAIYEKGNMSVAVSSNAENVKKSIQWRDAIKRFAEHDLI
ncbi:MAG: hypothetical protein A2W23_07980 [Planctomycetes bacterium RBG_16_43_13]|nr:MAG: hypothetical protein A2W23_07980 [Planctomycetes bacterium RBG_16_43_13]